jgi:hypothetical protein
MDELKSKIIATRTKMAVFGKNKNYVKLMDVIFVILGHFSKNYKKFFTK